MNHEHTFETFERHSVSQEVSRMGIRGAETRQCTGCETRMMFVELEGSGWVPLIKENIADNQNILMA